MALRAVLSPADLTADVLGPILGAEIGQVEVVRTAKTLAGAFAFVRIDGEARFVKWTRPESRSSRQAERNRRECRVLREASLRGDLPVPACHGALALEDGSSTIVLDDLSAEWAPSSSATPRWRERAVGALAALHAAFLNDDRLAGFAAPSRSAAEVRDVLRSRVAEMRTTNAVGNDQLTALVRIVEADDWENRLSRVAARERVTLLHGDAHAGNFLYERASDRAMLIDWELVEVGLAADDLAMFLCFYGPPNLSPLLDRYCDAAGVGREAFAADWRLAVLRLPLLVTAFWQNGARGEQLSAALSRALERVDALGR